MGIINLYFCYNIAPQHLRPAPGKNREKFPKTNRVHNLAFSLYFFELEQAIARATLCLLFSPSDAAAMALFSAWNSACAGLCGPWGRHRPTSPF